MTDVTGFPTCLNIPKKHFLCILCSLPILIFYAIGELKTCHTFFGGLDMSENPSHPSLPSRCGEGKPLDISKLPVIFRYIWIQLKNETALGSIPAAKRVIYEIGG